MRKLAYLFTVVLSLCLFVGLLHANVEVITLSNGVENSSSFVFTASSLDDIKDIDTTAARINIGNVYVDDNSEDGWKVTLASTNGGELRHTNYVDGSKVGNYLPYALYLNSATQSGTLGSTLISGMDTLHAMATDLTLDAKTGATVTGATYGYEIDVEFGLQTTGESGEAAFTGVFTDTITLTHVD